MYIELNNELVLWDLEAPEAMHDQEFVVNLDFIICFVL